MYKSFKGLLHVEVWRYHSLDVWGVVGGGRGLDTVTGRCDVKEKNLARSGGTYSVDGVVAPRTFEAVATGWEGCTEGTEHRSL